jgi:hypothetical protein
MDLLFLLLLLALGAYLLIRREQSRRIALLGRQLGQYQIETLMENLTEGYLRALGEADPERQTQIWNLLAASEMKLCEQFNRFVADFAKVDEADARVRKLAMLAPLDTLLPNLTFDMRQALSIHARGINQAVENRLNQPQKSKAFTLSAELFLMQHTCHWFCRSQSVASARMMMRHKTSYAQLIAAVAPETRTAYCALVGC